MSGQVREQTARRPMTVGKLCLTLQQTFDGRVVVESIDIRTDGLIRVQCRQAPGQPIRTFNVLP